MDEQQMHETAAALLADHAIRRASGAYARDIDAIRRRFAAQGITHEDIDQLIANRGVIVLFTL